MAELERWSGDVPYQAPLLGFLGKYDEIAKAIMEKAGCDHGIQEGDELGRISGVANEYLQVKSISFGKRNIRAISHYQGDLG